MGGNIKNIIVGCVLCVTVLLLTFFRGVYVGKQIQLGNDTVVQYQTQRQVDSLDYVIRKIEDQYKQTTYVQDSLTYELRIKQTDLNRIREKYEAKINNVVHYSSPELEQFFYDRYGSN